ncbi:Hypothetical predicted protein [Lecanosticta acicola]|uniref:AA1-like domain-containing protein n=1 Tax=Lecanosticta acicola TaxID=111012 RepID=A0AAI8Z3N8_9PEZI|nr:Hypothetical predicted protein [Lecanosticta acicola]
MYTTSIIIAAFAALAAAAPDAGHAAKRDTYYGIGLRVKITAAFTQPPEYSPAPVEINKLTSFGNTSCTEISFDSGVHPNVDVDSVECRAYKDEAGVIPGSAPFTNKQPAELGTNLVEIGSVLCYIRTEAEYE